ncbi:glycosyltransferase family 2 protein [Anaerobiospirillum succiniciproducens]|uniref:glycosyltransferase family 2 protein n=1 Tax=Anaerobiospirillum succiniciproducens TaxID=13335 RepID=UPI003F8B4AF3
MARYDNDYKVALIVPVYNEEETVATFVSTVEEKLHDVLEHIEIVFVDDGSKDNSAAIIEQMMQSNERIALIKLSRNFGKEAAMTAALDLCDADAVVPIDVDLQDPPELILDFIKIWRSEDVDTVYGIRADRSSDSDTKRISSGGFYYVFNKLSGKVKIPENVGDFRLIDSKVIMTVRNLNESNRFMKGLYAWPGFKSKGVPYVRPERSAGTTKWNYWKLWNFALDGIVSFSSLPIRVWSYIGSLVGVVAFVYMAYILLETLIFGVKVPGYASLMCVVLFLGSIQLISIGVLGEYLGRVSEEVKRRPVYVVSKIEGNLSNRLNEGYNRVNSGIYFNDRSSNTVATTASTPKSDAAAAEVTPSKANDQD